MKASYRAAFAAVIVLEPAALPAQSQRLVRVDRLDVRVCTG